MMKIKYSIVLVVMCLGIIATSILGSALLLLPPGRKNLPPEELVYQDKGWNGFRVEIIDSCEYLVKEVHGSGKDYGFGYMAHKGNCRYCKKRRGNVE